MTRLFASAWLALCLVAVSPALAQDDPKPLGHGTHAFRRLILHEQKLTPLDRLDHRLLDEPRRTILIVFGDTDTLDNLSRMRAKGDGLEQFIDQGGALLVATDRPTGGELADIYGLRVQGEWVRVDAGATISSYRQMIECPFVEPVGGKRPKIFQGLKRVATNRPSYLGLEVGKNDVLALFPRDCWTERRARAEGLPFAASVQSGKGKILIVADHSVFINDMILQGDNDNRQMALNGVSWLMDAGDRKRDRVLFVEDNEIETLFNVPITDPPWPSMAELVHMADELVWGLEEEDAFNRMLLDAVPMEQLWQWLTLALTVGLVAFGLTVLARSRLKPNTHVPLTAIEAAAQASFDPLMARRHRELAWRASLWEPARELARTFFEATLPLAAGSPSAPPSVHVNAGWWSGGKLRRQFHELWQLAYGEKPRRITLDEFERLPQRIQEVKAALEDGRLQIGMTNEQGLMTNQ